MAETVSVTIPHRLTKDEARRRLEEGFSRVTRQMAGRAVAVDQRWEGDRMAFSAAVMGQSITGNIWVRDTAVDLEIDLPWLLASMANVFKGRLKRETTLLLENKKPE